MNQIAKQIDKEFQVIKLEYIYNFIYISLQLNTIISGNKRYTIYISLFFDVLTLWTQGSKMIG